MLWLEMAQTTFNNINGSSQAHYVWAALVLSLLILLYNLLQSAYRLARQKKLIKIRSRMQVLDTSQHRAMSQDQ